MHTVLRMRLHDCERASQVPQIAYCHNGCYLPRPLHRVGGYQQFGRHTARAWQATVRIRGTVMLVGHDLIACMAQCKQHLSHKYASADRWHAEFGSSKCSREEVHPVPYFAPKTPHLHVFSSRTSQGCYEGMLLTYSRRALPVAEIEAVGKKTRH